MSEHRERLETLLKEWSSATAFNEEHGELTIAIGDAELRVALRALLDITKPPEGDVGVAIRCLKDNVKDCGCTEKRPCDWCKAELTVLAALASSQGIARHDHGVIEKLQAEAKRMRGVVKGIYIYINDTLSGRADRAPMDAEWYREAVVVARDKAKAILDEGERVE